MIDITLIRSHKNNINNIKCCALYNYNEHFFGIIKLHD